MCNVCGCGTGSVEGHSHHHDHGSGHHHHDHDHGHGHHHHHHHGDIHFGQGPAGVEVPGMTQERLIEIETDILAKNDRYADANRAILADREILTLNLVSSPGSGKTTLLCKTIEALGDQPLAVIEGDQQTANDADRIRATGAKAVQVNTGKGCHLDGHMVGHAMEHLDLSNQSMLFIENVGNLVCPAGFDLGEDAKVAILSVTEGEDKPLKYPDMFTASRLALLNKVDLAPYCDVDLDLYEENLRRVNPSIEIIRVSARTGEGMDVWLQWLRDRLAQKAKPEAAE
ncbi:MAG: hydrogenase nickel incorporation protein HypB [Donghicola eburneus]|nr:hydrogenase nickel incorporation protein HypB [Donghicola eburneus]MCI5038780.1 hydrogenase nickel incorporation protein HypB [Donghicola eburneus]